MSIPVAKRLFSTNDYHRMAEAGILSEDDRVELIEGEIIEMSPIGSRHAACVNCLVALLAQLVGQTAIVSVQNPIVLSHHSEPQADIVLLQPRADFYAHELPVRDDVLLVIEVADTSLVYDQNVKVPLYGEAGIPEIWLVDLSSHTITIYREPSKEGYQSSRTVQRGGLLTSSALPTLQSIDECLSL